MPEKESELPSWIPLDAWEGYKAMRKKIKKPMTDRAEKMAIAKLLELHMQGQCVQAVLEQSEFNCWQGLFAVRQEVRQAAPYMTANDKAKELADRLTGRGRNGSNVIIDITAARKLG